MTPIRSSLSTCARLIAAATNFTEEVRAIAAAHNHGYTLAQITAEVKRINAEAKR